MQTRSLILKPEQDLLLTIDSFAKNEEIHGFIIGSVGDLSKVFIKCPGNEEPTIINGHLELISLTGTISPKNVHLHLSISDSKCNVYGGHLESGSSVLKRIDVLFGIPFNGLNSTSKNTSINQEVRLHILTLPNCPWCARSIRLLKSNQIPHKVTQITNDKLFSEAKSRSGSSLFPQVYIDNNFIGGYSELSQYLKTNKAY